MNKMKPHLFLLSLFVVASCATAPSTTVREDGFTASMIHSVAFMPFIKAQDCNDIVAKKNIFLDCRIKSLIHDPEAYSPGAKEEITRVFFDELIKKFETGLKGYEKSILLFDDVIVIQKDKTLRTLAVNYASELDADYVFVGILDRYLDRKGAAHGVEQPASVFFRIYLIDTSTGSTVYEGLFEETQQSLLENILKAPSFFRRGARWLSAEDLSREGIKDILRRIH